MKSATSNLASTSGRLPAPLPTAPFAAYRAATQLSQSHTPRVILTLASGGEQAGASSTASVFSVKQLRASVPPAPPPIPVSEHQRRRKLKDAEEIAAAGRKLGLDPQRLKANLEQIDALVPDLVNLHKMKASEWAAVASDTNAVVAKLVTLKACYPAANAYKLAAARPRLLLEQDSELQAASLKVRALLTGASNVDAIIEAVPEVSDPLQLARSLAQLRASYPKKDAIALLEANPRILMNAGESDVGPDEEYSEDIGSTF